MIKRRENMAPGVRMFGSALASIGLSQSRKPKILGSKEIKNPVESTSPESSSPSMEIREASIAVFRKPPSILLEESHHSPSINSTWIVCENSLQAAAVNDNEFVNSVIQPRPPPGFHEPLNSYSPPNFQVHPSSSFSPFHASEVPINYSSSKDNLMSPINYTDYSMPLSKFATPQPSPSSNQENTPFSSANSLNTPISHKELRKSLYATSITDLNSTCSSSFSHEKMRETLYSISALDLCLQISGKLPDSTLDCTLPLNSQDSGCLLSDDNDSSETSAGDSQLFPSMSYYHMANTPELHSNEKQVLNEITDHNGYSENHATDAQSFESTSHYHKANSSELPSNEKQVLNEIPVPEKRPEPKQVADTLISSRVNRRNVSRIQGANTCLSSSRRSQTTLHMNRAYLPQSVAKYSSSEDSGAEVSMDEDLPPSPTYTDCRGCEALSEKVSLADTQMQYKPLPEYGKINFLSLKCQPGFIDSHCHLDFLLDRQDYDGTYTEYMQMHKGTYPASYEGCVAVFCNPHTFHKRAKWQKYFGEKGVWGTFGCHPHYSKFYDAAVEHHLKQAILHSKVRALGEIGLDYSDRNDCSLATQHHVFRQQLKIALYEKLPLVIHCRDANEDTMNIMKQILPKNYLIHLHCFTDGWDWAQKWLKEFPNLCIGITNLVTFPSATPTHDVVKRIPLDRLLLETDAPYFIPRKIARTTKAKYSHPGMAIHVAAQIAALREVSLKEIIHYTRLNTKKVYGI